MSTSPDLMDQHHSDMVIGKRIALGFGIVLAVMLINVFISVSSSGAIGKQVNALASQLGSLKQASEAEMDSFSQKAQEIFEETSSSRWTLGLVGCLNLLLGLGVSFWVTRGINRALGRIAADMHEAVTQLNEAATQVSGSSQKLAEGAAAQASSLEETASSLVQMASVTSRNAENAGMANTLTTETRTVVEEANQSMQALNTSMQDISKASDETQKIIKTIDEIAFQTNLLALNAAVEAARAGEAGAGFAVVADEVRSLAMRAANAARSTAELIESTGLKIRDGFQIVQRTNDSFHKVEERSKKAGELVSEISTSSKEQSHGIDEINRAVSSMDQITQANASSSQESAAAAQELSAQGTQMAAVVKRLVRMVGHMDAGHTEAQKISFPVGAASFAHRPLPVVAAAPVHVPRAAHTAHTYTASSMPSVPVAPATHAGHVPVSGKTPITIQPHFGVPGEFQEKPAKKAQPAVKKPAKSKGKPAQEPFSMEPIGSTAVNIPGKNPSEPGGFKDF